MGYNEITTVKKLLLTTILSGIFDLLSFFSGIEFNNTEKSLIYVGESYGNKNSFKSLLGTRKVRFSLYIFIFCDKMFVWNEVVLKNLIMIKDALEFC